MSRRKYIIEGVNPIEDIIHIKEYYVFSLNGINYVIPHKFIKGRFMAMKFENEPKYFGYIDSHNIPCMLNGLFLPIGEGMEYDFKLIKLKEDEK